MCLTFDPFSTSEWWGGNQRLPSDVDRMVVVDSDRHTFLFIFLVSVDKLLISGGGGLFIYLRVNLRGTACRQGYVFSIIICFSMLY